MEFYRKEAERLKKLPKEEFKKTIEALSGDIWSFPGLHPPGNCTEVGQIERNGDVYHYYMNTEGKLYFENDSGYRWKEKMEQLHYNYR